MATLRADFPIVMNSTTVFRPEKWKYQAEKIQEKNVSEAGTDILQTTRTGKLKIDAEFASTASWVKFFRGLDALDSFKLKIYDPVTEAYKEYDVYMEGYSDDWEVHSDYLTNTMGLYTVTFSLIEF